jgi:hypothetical protein
VKTSERTKSPDGVILDVALFEAGRATLRRRMEHATEAIHRTMEELLNEQDAGG